MMNKRCALLVTCVGYCGVLLGEQRDRSDRVDQPHAGDLLNTQRHPSLQITIIDPPEKDFFSKLLDFHGIPIKAHQDVADEALWAAHGRLSLLFSNLLSRQPMLISNLVAAGAELHIIGRDQVTTDLPEWRHDKGKPLA